MHPAKHCIEQQAHQGDALVETRGTGTFQGVLARIPRKDRRHLVVVPVLAEELVVREELVRGAVVLQVLAHELAVDGDGFRLVGENDPR